MNLLSQSGLVLIVALVLLVNYAFAENQYQIIVIDPHLCLKIRAELLEHIRKNRPLVVAFTSLDSEVTTDDLANFDLKKFAEELSGLYNSKGIPISPGEYPVLTLKLDFKPKNIDKLSYDMSSNTSCTINFETQGYITVFLASHLFNGLIESNYIVEHEKAQTPWNDDSSFQIHNINLIDSSVKTSPKKKQNDTSKSEKKSVIDKLKNIFRKNK